MVHGSVRGVGELGADEGADRAGAEGRAEGRVGGTQLQSGRARDADQSDPHANTTVLHVRRSSEISG